MRLIASIILVVAVALLAFLIRIRSAKQIPLTVNMATDTDQDVLDQLRRTGSDLTQPHEFDFYVYLPTHEAATKAEKQIKDLGLVTKIEPATTDQQWLCLASKTFVPTKPAIHAIQQRLEQIATELGGDYDGWEADVRR